MSSDEDDYMSDKFLLKESEDVRPGIPKRKVDQRNLELYKKKLKSEQPSVQQKEAINRDEGLSTAIASDNKGFQMLAKMGYKAGSSLGSSNSGIVEPISINLKQGKGGLGRLKKPLSKGTKDNVTPDMQSSYRKAVQDKKTMAMIRSYYFKAQSSCIYLDEEQGIEVPVAEYFWPRRIMKEREAKAKEKAKLARDKAAKSRSSDDDNDYNEDEEEEEEEEIPTEEYLNEIVRYLRCTYFYCIFCGAKATDQEDLDSFCPGESYDDHDMS